MSPHENPLREDLEHVLTHTRELWEAARGRRIFVTGGTGFFGRWLLESFSHINHQLALRAQIVVLSRDPAAFAEKAPHLARDPAISFVRGDVRTLSASMFDIPRFDFVVHAATAASAKLNQESPLLMFDTIVQGTRATLDFAIGAGARRFLLTSSGAVYGPQPSETTHVPEDYLGGPTCPDTGSAYGEGKRIAEFLCACYANQHGIEPLIARCFAFVGPFLPLDTHFAIGNFIRDALAGGPIRVGGDGTPCRSYLYAADLTIWLWTILFKGVPARPYNVGSTRDLPIIDVAEAVKEALDARLQITVAKQPRPRAAPSRYVPATKRAEMELGLIERIALPEAIRRTALASPKK